MKKSYLAVVLLTLLASNIQAQQDPHSTQYMYNMNVINPAYAGSKEGISGGLLYRDQWDGLDGAPKTASFAVSSPVGKNVGLGLSIVSDKIGPVEENNLYGDFSYTLNLGGEHRLALGVKAGGTFQKIGLFSDIGDGNVSDSGDRAFSQNTNNAYFNVGTGAFYYTEKYYVGVSVPNLLNSKHLDVTENGQAYQFGSEVSHYFVTGGYIFDLSENTKFKPSFMLKSAFNVEPSLDLSANFLLYNKLELGATYRLDDSFGAMINFAIIPGLRIGYAYDYIVSDLKVAAPASHEFMLLFDLNTPKKVSISPRFF